MIKKNFMNINPKKWEMFVQWAEETYDTNTINGFKETTELYNHWNRLQQKKIERQLDELSHDIEDDEDEDEDLDEIEDMFSDLEDDEYEGKIFDDDEDEYENQLTDEDLDEIESWNEFDEPKIIRVKTSTKSGEEDEISEFNEYKFNPNQEVKEIIETNQDKETLKEIFKYAKKDFINQNIQLGDKENNLKNCEMISYTEVSNDNPDNLRVMQIYFKLPEDMDRNKAQNELKKICEKAAEFTNQDMRIYRRVNKNNLNDTLFINSLSYNTTAILKELGYEVIKLQEVFI